LACFAIACFGSVNCVGTFCSVVNSPDGYGDQRDEELGGAVVGGWIGGGAGHY
jgi:hypothetical protein